MTFSDRPQRWTLPQPKPLVAWQKVVEDWIVAMLQDDADRLEVDLAHAVALTPVQYRHRIVIVEELRITADDYSILNRWVACELPS